MGWILDNINATVQASEAFATRLDTVFQPTITQGGAGPRNSIIQNWSFGQSKLNADTGVTQENVPWWIWLAVGLVILLMVWKKVKG